MNIHNMMSEHRKYIQISFRGSSEVPEIYSADLEDIIHGSTLWYCVFIHVPDTISVSALCPAPTSAPFFHRSEYIQKTFRGLYTGYPAHFQERVEKISYPQKPSL